MREPFNALHSPSNSPCGAVLTMCAVLSFQECEVKEGGLAEVGKLVHLISLFRLNNKPEQVSPLHGVDGYYHTCVHSMSEH